MVGFLASWSAVRKLVETQGNSAFDEPIKELDRIWQKGSRNYEIRWPLHFRIGKLK